MKKEVNPQETGRSSAFKLWMSSPMPMVTLVKTMDVSRLIKYSKRNGASFLESLQKTISAGIYKNR